MPNNPSTNRWLLATLWVALVTVYAVGLRFGMQGIESNLEESASRELMAAGLAGVSVHFTGREATLTGEAPTVAAVSAAQRVVEQVEGVRWVKSAIAVARRPAPVPPPAPEPVTPPVAERAAPTLTVRRVGDNMHVSGTVAAAHLGEARRQLARLPADQVTDELEAGDVLERAWTRQIWTLLPVIHDAPGVEMGVVDATLTLSGEVSDAARRSGLESAAAAVAFELSVDNRITVRPDPKLVAQRALDALTQAVAGQDLLFSRGSTRVQATGVPHLERVAAVLKGDPTLKIEVRGYTDNIGTVDENIALGASRARRVRAALVELGVDGAQIHAAGGGEADPVADNSTAEGRAHNRRIKYIVKD